MNKKSILAVLATGIMAVGNAGAQQVDTVFTSASLYEPMGVAAFGDYIYVTASVSNRIARFHPGTGVLDVLAGSASGLTNSTDSVNGSAARFYSPQGIIVDTNRGGLVVSDSGNNRIRFVTFNGAVTTLALGFNYPVGMARDASGNIYIADAGNGAIKILHTDNSVSTLATGFNQPFAVAVGINGQVWVADTRNNVIKLIQTTGTGLGVARVGEPIIVAGNTNGIAGGADAEDALFGYFNNPRGLLWVGGSTGLLVSDTANQVIRRIYTNSVLGGWSSALVAGAYGVGGFVNGQPLDSRWRSPIALCMDSTSDGFLVVDRENYSIRRLQNSAPMPRIANPEIGYIRLKDTSFGYLAVLTPVNIATFQNDEVIGVSAEPGVQTYYTWGPTPADPLDTSSIPDPGPGVGSTAPPFVNNQPQLPENMVGPAPNFIVKARSSGQGRMASEVVKAQFIFKVGTPVLVGDNPAYLPVNNSTTGARMFYTTNGLDPVDGIGTENFGPIRDGDVINLPRSETNTTVKVRAWRDNFQPSDVVTKILSASSFSANKMTLGFTDGEGSSRFQGAPGQRFMVPVTMELLENQTMFSLQFNASVASLSGAPLINTATLGFESMLMQRVDTPSGPVYYQMPPSAYVGTGMTNLYITNNALGTLLLGWFESPGATNLFNTRIQHLVSYSIAHDTLFTSVADRKVVVGGFYFQVPPTATPGSVYQVAVGRPSATRDGVQTDVFIDVPTNRSIRELRIAQMPYVVGDCMPFGWFNAGDFGDSSILSADLVQVFQAVGYGQNVPDATTDFFDAMDSCCGDTNGVTDHSINATFYADSGIDTIIDKIGYGNRTLEVNDLFVSFRRALDSSRVWYARYWPTNAPDGNRRYTIVPNQYRGLTNAAREAVHYSFNNDGSRPLIRLTAADVTPVAGQEVEVPITAEILGGAPLRVLWLRLQVNALDGSPALTVPVRFVPSSSFGNPTISNSRGINDYFGAWLDNTKGLEASGPIGSLFVTIPANASASSVYKVTIASFSGSPNGLGLFPFVKTDGLLALSDRSGSSASDGLPDAWKLRYFNTLNNLLTHATADADGDGIPNWQEYKAGTHPNDAASRLELLANRIAAARAVVLKWPTVAGKQYVIEATDDLAGEWTTVASGIVGDGLMREFQDAQAAGGLRFYRVRLQE